MLNCPIVPEGKKEEADKKGQRNRKIWGNAIQYIPQSIRRTFPTD